MELLPNRAARSFLTRKLNVFDDDIPLTLRIQAFEKLTVTMDFLNNLMCTPEKGFKLTRSGLGHRIWRVKLNTHKLHMKQRIRKVEKIYWTERICNEEVDRKRIYNEEIDRKRFKNIHLRFGHASKKNASNNL